LRRDLDLDLVVVATAQAAVDAEGDDVAGAAPLKQQGIPDSADVAAVLGGDLP
jgi:hypothetical protein